MNSSGLIREMGGTGSVGQGMARSNSSVVAVGGSGKQQVMKENCRERSGVGLFSMGRSRTMPVTRAEQEAVPEWKLHCLLSEHGLPVPIKGHLMGGCFF